MNRGWAGEVRNVSLLVAIAVNAEGYREILGICEGAKEDKAGCEMLDHSTTAAGPRGCFARIWPSQHRPFEITERIEREDCISMLTTCASASAWCTAAAALHFLRARCFTGTCCPARCFTPSRADDGLSLSR